MQPKSWPAEWMRAALGLCVLRTLAPGPTYGYAIASALESAGFGVIKGGTLYPLLTRFEAAGWIAAEWRPGAGGPGRKYFALTDSGQHELSDQSGQWKLFATTVHDHLQKGPAA
ncbi:PadR family transcriptional regulator [Cryobacterium sp. Y50]|uniref:PadR family transcriptional regulator n=1 Tax=Cryobacterium sp. Y50 TaxID=2048286 RepID=UPI000CE54C21|nr:PadR family transcriptional regulator [Cryobacterium sp. Y50]